MEEFKPRNKYGFDKLGVGDLLVVEVPADDPRAGARALCAAYAYGRRNGMKFFGHAYVTANGSRFMKIGRSE